METLPLRQLLRDPKRVKKLTLAGITVRITDGGKPLWDIRPPLAEDESGSADAEAQRHRLWEEHFAGLAAVPPANPALPSVAEVMEHARGEGR